MNHLDEFDLMGEFIQGQLKIIEGGNYVPPLPSCPEDEEQDTLDFMQSNGSLD
jgi:hypothetical protein